MPSANVKPAEKISGGESLDPLRQAITIIEHKIRNLEKRKGKLDSYREIKASGKALTREQTEAVGKYDEVVQQLELSKEYVKQFTSLGDTSDKAKKRQAKRDTLERTTTETAKIKQVLIIQDVLQNMGLEAVRKDFLAGLNGAPTLTDADLKCLDDLYSEILPKREGPVSFAIQLQKSAEHLMTIIEGRTREVAGSTGLKIQSLVSTIHACGYFDQPEPVAEEPEPEVPTEPATPEEPAPVEEIVRPPPAEEVPLPVQQPLTNMAGAAPMIGILQNIVPVSQVESNMFNAQGFQPPAPVASVSAADVMSRVGGNLTFFQDSQIEGSDVVAPAGIPSRTFTNQALNGQPPMSYPQPTPNNPYVYNVQGMYPQELIQGYAVTNGTMPPLPSQRPVQPTEPRTYTQPQPVQQLNNGFPGAVPATATVSAPAVPLSNPVAPTQTFQEPVEPITEPTASKEEVVGEHPKISDWAEPASWDGEVSEWNPAGAEGSKKPSGGRPRGERPRNYNRSGNRNGYSSRSGGGGGNRDSGNYYNNSNGYREREHGPRGEREREYQPRDREFRGDRGDREFSRADRGDRDQSRGDNNREYTRSDRGERDFNRSDRAERGERDHTRGDRDQNRSERGDRDQNRGERGDRENRGDFNGYGNYRRGGPPRGARSDRGDRGDRTQGNSGPRNNSGPRPPRSNPRPQTNGTYRQEAQDVK